MKPIAALKARIAFTALAGAAFLGLSAMALLPQSALAQTGAQVSTAPETTLNITYSVRARGITAGEFSFRTTFNGDAYSVAADRRMTGLVRAAVGASQDYSYSVRGTRAGTILSPAAYRHQGGRRNRLVQAAFSADDVVTTATPEMGMGHPPATQAQRRGTIDQLTAMASLMLASGDPCARTLRVYMDGRSRFDFAMSANGRQRVNIAGFRGEARRCSVQFRPIAGFSDPQEAATLTFLVAPLPNGMYVPLRIEMPSDDNGIVTLEARSYQVRGARPN
ncbi:MAG: DUF3108 domain-containing protein [Hyphomonadaceae bacterium]